MPKQENGADAHDAAPCAQRGAEPPIVVQKYGGSSVATVEKIQGIAQKVVDTRAQGYRVVVVVSAMGNTTNELLGLARAVNTEPSGRELDVLLSSGERISTAVLSLAIERLGCPAVSLTGRQCNILTEGVHGSARIRAIEPRRILAELDGGKVVVVAGFQGVNDEGEDTTLGRGGSDTSAVALAAALGASHCDIYSDVAGVFSADPRVVQGARRLEELSYEEMQAYARHGARVLNADAVEFARREAIAIYARSTFGGPESTIIHRLEQPRRGSGFGIAGVAGSDELLRLRCGEGGRPGPRAAEVLDALDGCEILAGAADDARFDMLVSTTNVPCNSTFAASLAGAFDDRVEVSPEVASVTAVGVGVGDQPDALAYARRALGAAEVNVVTSFARGEALTCVVPSPEVVRGVRALHRAFIEAPEVFA